MPKLKNVLIYSEHGKQDEAYTTLSEICRVKKYPYNKLKTESFPIDLGNIVIQKLKLN
jgi:hypothetical protein